MIPVVLDRGKSNWKIYKILGFTLQKVLLFTRYSFNPDKLWRKKRSRSYGVG